MNVQSLDIISVNIWQILISLANLLILFLILKHFLFKPVQNVFRTRREQLDDLYDEANQSRAAAEGMKQEYEEKLAAARDEADGLVRAAVAKGENEGADSFRVSREVPALCKWAEAFLPGEQGPVKNTKIFGNCG